MTFNRLDGVAGLLGWGIKSGVASQDEEEFEFRIAIEHEYTYNEYHISDLDRIITEPIAESYSYFIKPNEHVINDWKIYSQPNLMVDGEVSYSAAVKHADEICMRLFKLIPEGDEIETLRRNALLTWLNGFVYDERVDIVSKMSVPYFHRFVSILPMYRNSKDAFGEAINVINLPQEYVDGLFKTE